MVSRRLKGQVRALPKTIGSKLSAVPECSPSQFAKCGSTVGNWDARDFIAFKQCQEMLKARFTQPLLALLAELTGLTIHVFWHAPLTARRRVERTILCPSVRRTLNLGGEPSAACRICLQQRWSSNSATVSDKRLFIGRCGSRYCCLDFRWANACFLTLVLQAPALGHNDTLKRVSSEALRPLNDSRPAGDPMCVTRDEVYDRAVALLDDLVQELRLILASGLVQPDQESTRGWLQHSGAEHDRFGQGPSHLVQGDTTAPRGLGGGSHAEQIVAAMIDFLHHHFQRPMTLGEVAAEVKMNASYLSSLFSKTMGVTFHHYLDELRLAKAEQLLRDPRTRICEVASTVGYASPNHFRKVFKAYEGVSPSAWRALRNPVRPHQASNDDHPKSVPKALVQCSRRR
jgi:AraC-like DNA-binding protein